MATIFIVSAADHYILGAYSRREDAQAFAASRADYWTEQPRDSVEWQKTYAEYTISETTLT